MTEIKVTPKKPDNAESPPDAKISSPLLDIPVVDKKIVEPEVKQTPPTSDTSTQPPNTPSDGPPQTPPPDPLPDDPGVKEMHYEPGGEKKEDEDKYKGASGASSAFTSIFSDIVAEAICGILPLIPKHLAKIYMPKIQMFVQKGLLDPIFLDIFERTNANTDEKLSVTDDEKERFARALQIAFEVKSVSWAKPENAWIAQLLFIGGRLGMETPLLISENRKMMADALKMSKPDLYARMTKEQTEKAEEKMGSKTEEADYQDVTDNTKPEKKGKTL